MTEMTDFKMLVFIQWGVR